MFYMCDCPMPCGNGSVGFWRCGDNKSIILRCDECETPWLQPRDVLAGLPLSIESSNLPGTKVPIYGAAASWATRDEIEKVGWSSFICGEGAALGDSN